MKGYDIFFALLRSGLYGRELTPEVAAVVSRLTPERWMMLVSMAKKQTVTGLFYDAVLFLSKDASVPSDITLDLMARTLSIENDSRHKAELTARLVKRFHEQGLSPVVLKGSSVAEYYHQPLHRTSGDIDLYLTSEDMDKALSMLAEWGESPGGLRRIVEGIEIDTHSNYYDLHVAQSKLPAPGTPEAVLTMLSAHILKHITGVGIGLRQFCDLAAAWKALAGACDRELLLMAERAGRIRKWDKILSSFIAQRFDMPLMHDTLFPGEEPCNSDRLLDIVMEGGNFGYYSSERINELRHQEKQRKIGTVKRFVKRLPFSLRYAPHETLATLRTLVRKNFSYK